MSSHLECHNLFESPTVQSCLFALQKLVSMRYPTHPGMIFDRRPDRGFDCVLFSPGEEAQYLSVVESGLLTVLDLAKTAPQQSRLDPISLLLAIKGETGLS